MERVRTALSQWRRRAFSLIELLAVMAIIAVLMAMALPAIRSGIEASDLQRSGFLVHDAVIQARQLATARNIPVEMRIYQIPINGELRWAAIRIGAAENGTFTPLTRLISLGSVSAVALEFSPILQQTGGIQGTQNLPAQGGNVSYRGFRIRPDGSLERFVDSDANYLTVFPARALAGSNTTLPENFFAVQINPYTGTPEVRQP